MRKPIVIRTGTSKVGAIFKARKDRSYDFSFSKTQITTNITTKGRVKRFTTDITLEFREVLKKTRCGYILRKPNFGLKKKFETVSKCRKM